MAVDDRLTPPTWTGGRACGAREKAIKNRASKVYIEDCGGVCENFICFAIKANAGNEGGYLMEHRRRPLIAKRQIEIARMENADAVSHGSTGKGNDQVRFELTYYAFEPNIRIIAPWREWSFASREELIDYARQHGIDVPVSKAKPYSMDRNLMHISYEGGILEDPWMEPSEDMFLTTVSPEKAPDAPRYIEIDFQEGAPVRIDGKPMSPFEIVAFLNKAGGENGVGRFDIVENRLCGHEVEGVYDDAPADDTPCATGQWSRSPLDREVMHMRDSLVQDRELTYTVLVLAR